MTRATKSEALAAVSVDKRVENTRNTILLSTNKLTRSFEPLNQNNAHR